MRLHLLESALAVVIIGGDFGAGGFLAQAAIGIVAVAGVALALQLVAQVVAGCGAIDASLGAGGEGTVAVGVVLVLLYPLAVFCDPGQAVVVILDTSRALSPNRIRAATKRLVSRLVN